LYLNSWKRKFQVEKDILYNEYANFIKNLEEESLEKYIEKYKEIQMQEIKERFDSSKNHILDEYLKHKYEKYKGVEFASIEVKDSIKDYEKELNKAAVYRRFGAQFGNYMSKYSLIYQKM
jgi:hypothetical protein